jgi:hypothetical protein
VGNLEIDARFALGPRQLHLRPDEIDSASRILVDAAMGRMVVGGEEVLKKFPHLDAFQEVLGRMVGMDPYDPRVQEGYWIGNNLLKRALGKKVGMELVNCYRRHNLPSFYLTELERLSLQKVVLHHNFQVTQISVLDSGGLRGSLVAVNNCLVRLATVNGVESGQAEIQSVELRKKHVGYGLERTTERVSVDLGMVGELQEGDKVAVHWGAVAMKLDKKQSEQLEQWTKEVVKNL